MGKTYLWVLKEGLDKKIDSLDGFCKDRELSNEEEEEDSSGFSDSQLNKLIKGAAAGAAAILNSRGAIFVDTIVQSLMSKDFVPFHGHKIPKNIMVRVDEKYLRCFLELTHMKAFKGSGRDDIAVSSRRANILVSQESSDPGQFIFECPVTDGSGSLVISASPVWWSSLSSVMRSKSMVRILSSPLFHQFGASDKNENYLSMMNCADAKELTCHDSMDSPSGVSISSSAYKPEKETPVIMKSRKFGSSVSSVHEMLASTSSTNSDGLSSFASPTPFSQGMLQCTWRDGIPRFVFSMDDKKEMIYVASLMKGGPNGKNKKSLDYVYLIRLDKGKRKSGEISGSDSQLVGKMNVSTSFTLNSNNDKIMETEFVLFCDNENYHEKQLLYSSSFTHDRRNKKGLPRKFSQVFRRSLSKHTTTTTSTSKFDHEQESCPWDPNANSGVNLLETSIPPNFEMAAIVVKDHIPCAQPNEVGGWGLKFLNKSKLKQTPSSRRESCARNTGGCSSSTDILIPAGIHGGPRDRNGGPSGLIDRWRSGGRCNCGGWDEGCPLTVYQTRFTKDEAPSGVDMKGESKNVDLVTLDSGDLISILRMVSVFDNLYFIHFRPPLTSLQSFSIVAAIIHTQSPIFRSDTAQLF